MSVCPENTYKEDVLKVECVKIGLINQIIISNCSHMESSMKNIITENIPNPNGGPMIRPYLLKISSKWSQNPLMKL